MQGRFEVDIPKLDEEKPEKVDVGLEFIAGEGEKEFLLNN